MVESFLSKVVSLRKKNFYETLDVNRPVFIKTISSRSRIYSKAILWFATVLERRYFPKAAMINISHDF